MSASREEKKVGNATNWSFSIEWDEKENMSSSKTHPLPLQGGDLRRFPFVLTSISG